MSDDDLIRMRGRKTIQQRQREAAQWFIASIRGLDPNSAAVQNVKASDIEPQALFTNRREVSSRAIGQILFWAYDPKHKDTLPYYDTFPLVVLLRELDDGFLGLNVHYLPYTFRMAFIQELHKRITSNTLSSTSRARISWDLVKGTSELKVAKPCIKRYLFSHVRSKIVRIHPVDWHHAAVLPIERFAKASKHKVWRDSMRIARGR